MSPVIGVKFLTADGMSLTTENGPVHYPVDEWVTVPGNGAYVAFHGGYYGRHRDLLVARFECEEPTGAEIIYGVKCFRRVKRLAEKDMEWLKSLSVRVRCDVARHGTDEHRDVLVNDPAWQVRKAVAYFGNSSHRNILLHDWDESVSWTARNCYRALQDRKAVADVA